MPHCYGDRRALRAARHKLRSLPFRLHRCDEEREDHDPGLARRVMTPAMLCEFYDIDVRVEDNDGRPYGLDYL